MVAYKEEKKSDGFGAEEKTSLVGDDGKLGPVWYERHWVDIPVVRRE
jgi:hypothetical protein